MTALLPESILRQARHSPDAPAVVWERGKLSYYDLVQRAGRLAHALAARGVSRESTVGVCIRPSPDLVVALLGIWLAGGCYLPLDPFDPVERRRRILADADASVVLADPDEAAAEQWSPSAVLVCRVAELEREGYRLGSLEAGIHPRHAAYLIFTSGSTGTPKGVVIEHAGIANLVWWAIRALRLSAADRILQKTPLTFDAAGWEIFAPLLCGSPVTFGEADAGRDPAALVSSIQAMAVTVVQVVPSMLRMLVAESGLSACRSLRTICSGGEQLHAELCHEVLSKVDVDIWNTYGPTECSINVTAARFDPATRSGPVPIGHAIDNARCLVVSPEVEVAETGSVGELYTGGVGVGRGYYGRPALTAERFVPDASGPPGARMYRTGDLVRSCSDGGLEFVGRADAQLKLNGVRIEPGEVETALLSHPEVADAAVRIATDQREIQRLAACVVTVSREPVDGLIGYLRDRLPRALVPTAFAWVAALPRTTSGKVDRARLPEPDWTGALWRTSATVPEDAQQRIVLGVWRQLLGSDEISLDDDFFRLGGHSLLLTRLATRLTEASGLEVELRDLYQVMTARSQAELLSRAMRVEPIPRLPDGARLPLSPAQERFWVLDRMRPGSPEYLLPVVVRLPAGVSPGGVEQALVRLAARHDALRSRYVMGAEGLFAVVDNTSRVPLRTVDATPDDLQGLISEELATGFDLTKGPLWRAVLLRDDGAEQLLLVVCHHIISDGWSAGIIDREVRELVAASEEDRAPRLPDLPLRYVDVVAWQRSRLTGDLLDRQIEYWRDKLSDMPVWELRGSGDRDALRRYEGAAVTFEIPADVAVPLLETGRQAGATPFMVLLTVWTVSLAQISGQWDFGVGTPHAGRGRPESYDLVGPFLDIVVIRSQLTPELTFSEALTAVRRTCRDGIAHSAVPFESVVEALAPSRDLSRTPLFQVLFTLLDDELIGSRPRRNDVELLRHAWLVARTDLNLTMWRQKDGSVGGALEYASALYSQAVAEEISARTRSLAERFAMDSDSPIGAANHGDGDTGMSSGSLPHEGAILSLFRELLENDEIGAEESFFERGGNSLLAARLLWGIQNTFGVDLPMRAVFDEPTAAGIARLVEESVRTDFASSQRSVRGVEEGA